jgi:hypothetical protein
MEITEMIMINNSVSCKKKEQIYDSCHIFSFFFQKSEAPFIPEPYIGSMENSMPGGF